MRKKRVYLDNCCFNRPYDDQNFLSIFLETQAKMSIQELVRLKSLVLIWSTVLDYENSRNPDEIIRDEIGSWRDMASVIIHQSEFIIKRAYELNSHGISKKDALHIASAIEGQSDYFITTDYGILRKSKYITEIKTVNPVDFIRILEEEE